MPATPTMTVLTTDPIIVRSLPTRISQIPTPMGQAMSVIQMMTIPMVTVMAPTMARTTAR